MAIDKKNLLTRRNFLKGAVGISLLAAGAYFLPGTSLFRRAQNSARMLSGDLHARYVPRSSRVHRLIRAVSCGKPMLRLPMRQ